MKTKTLTSLKNYSYSEKKIFKKAKDFLPINGTDHVELYVGNAKQAAHYYKTAFGFQELAYCGLETGVKESCSYVLMQGKIRLVLTTPLDPNSKIAEHIRKHGDGVKVIALEVDDVRTAYYETMRRGAKSYFAPEIISDKDGEVIRAGIHTYGETIHVFVERRNYKGVFMPGFAKWKTEYNPPPEG